jgi:hypothetical protein
MTPGLKMDHEGGPLFKENDFGAVVNRLLNVDLKSINVAAHICGSWDQCATQCYEAVCSLFRAVFDHGALSL